MFLQWVTDCSFAAAQARAHDAGMRIGLIADLAVGMDPAGSHAWSQPNDILRDLMIGAPPDLFSPNGQNWGITSFSPRALMTTGFAPFLATVRAALRNAGGVRIDHIIGLQRLWLVPRGAAAAEGAYFNYPLTDLLRLLALELYRHKAVVIGEDLGTVPEGFRDKLNAAWHSWYARPVVRTQCRHVSRRQVRWERTSIAMTSTHDLPTLAGWWRGDDINVRAAHGLLGVEHDVGGIARRARKDRAALWRAFQAAGPEQGLRRRTDETQTFVGAAIRFVASTPAALFLLPLEDALGLTEQPNLPGTIDQHPNWRRRTHRSVDRLLNNAGVIGGLGGPTLRAPAMRSWRGCVPALQRPYYVNISTRKIAK